MRNLKSKLLGFGAGLLMVASVAFGAIYYGYNPNTGLETFHGAPVSGGNTPAVSGTCGTIGAVTGGAGVFTVATAAVTSCTLTVTIPSAAPNGVFCVFVDETTVADATNMHQASHNSTSCTSNAATIVAGDTILVEINGF